MINKNWEEEFELKSFDDYKIQFAEWDRLRQQNSDENWIYIGGDSEKPTTAKIGLTSRSLASRATGTQNPDYLLHIAFKVKEGVSAKRLAEIERFLIKQLSSQYQRIMHKHTGYPSEWFCCSPEEMQACVEFILEQNFTYEMYCHHCPIRGYVVFQHWKQGDPRYVAGDPEQPVDPDCYQQGGCGADCDCWS